MHFGEDRNGPAVLPRGGGFQEAGADFASQRLIVALCDDAAWLTALHIEIEKAVNPRVHHAGARFAPVDGQLTIDRVAGRVLESVLAAHEPPHDLRPAHHDL